MGCGGGGGTAPAPDDSPSPDPNPSLAIHEPAVDMVPADTIVEIVYDASSQLGATPTFVADEDGNIETTADQFAIAERWDTGAVAPGSYAIFGTLDDGEHAPVVAMAPGRVNVLGPLVTGARGLSMFASGLPYEELAASVAAFPDGSSVVVGYFGDTNAGPGDSALFGEGEPNETLLERVGESDAFVARFDSQGKLMWARRDGGLSIDRALGVATFDDGSCIVTGFSFLHLGGAVFGEGEAQETHFGRATAAMFLARYNKDGTLAWAVQTHSLYARGTDVATLPDGSCIVVGFYSGECIFQKSGPNYVRLDSKSRSVDPFIARYDRDGKLIGVFTAPGEGFDIARDVAVHADGSFVVAGYYTQDINFGLGTSFQTGTQRAYTARFDANGDFVAARSIPAADATAVATFPGGAFLVTGAFGGQPIFGAGEPNETLLDAGIGGKTFVARYEADGTLGWARRGGGADVATFADGSFAATGLFRGTVVFGAGDANEIELESAGNGDLFVSRHRADGSLLWLEHAGGPLNDAGHRVAAMPDGSVFVSALVFGVVELNGTPVGETNRRQLALARLGTR